jgi:hypothetical protein
MPSYSSWNGEKMHGNKHLLTDLLKKELGFKVRFSGAFFSCFLELDFQSAQRKSPLSKGILGKILAKYLLYSSWEW